MSLLLPFIVVAKEWTRRSKRWRFCCCVAALAIHSCPAILLGYSTFEVVLYVGGNNIYYIMYYYLPLPAKAPDSPLFLLQQKTHWTLIIILIIIVTTNSSWGFLVLFFCEPTATQLLENQKSLHKGTVFFIINGSCVVAATVLLFVPSAPLAGRHTIHAIMRSLLFVVASRLFSAVLSIVIIIIIIILSHDRLGHTLNVFRYTF